jgi:hypothetical protein
MAVERVRRQKTEQQRDEAITAGPKADERRRPRLLVAELQRGPGRVGERWEAVLTPGTGKASQAAPRSSRAGSDADTDTESTGTRRACITVPQTIRKPRRTMPATLPPL